MTSTKKLINREQARPTVRAVLDEVHRGHDTQRHGDEGGEPDLLQRPDERVVDTAPSALGDTLRIDVVRKPALSALIPLLPP